MVLMKKTAREGKIQSVETLLKQAMPPRYEAMEKLEKTAREWESVVGPILAKQSVPLDIVNGELVVGAENPLVANRVAMMVGNITRALAKRWKFEVSKVKVVVGRLPLKDPRKESRAAPSVSARPPVVRVREEDIREFESHCLKNQPDFPPAAAESLARLRAFFIKRFGRGK